MVDARACAVDVNLFPGWTPLIHAVNEGCFNNVTCLLEHNANVEAKDNDGRTPLICAARNGNICVVKHLIEHNANMDAKDNDGNNALQHARIPGIDCSPYVIEYLELLENVRIVKQLLEPHVAENVVRFLTEERVPATVRVHRAIKRRKISHP